MKKQHSINAITDSNEYYISFVKEQSMIVRKCGKDLIAK